jgi:hypothetical protein
MEALKFRPEAFELKPFLSRVPINQTQDERAMIRVFSGSTLKKAVQEDVFQSTEQNTRSSLTNVGEELDTELDHMNFLPTSGTSFRERSLMSR